MKAKRRMAALVIALVMVFGGVSAYAGTSSARDSYAYPGRATVFASAFISESGWWKHRCSNTASIGGEDKDAAGTLCYQFYNNDNIYMQGCFGLGYQYFIQREKEGYFSETTTQVYQGASPAFPLLLSVTAAD